MRIGVFLAALFVPFITQAAIVMGNPEGSVVITEVYDYECPYCREEWPILESIVEAHPEIKLRLMPVAILNEISLKEATSAIVATNFPGKFQTLHQAFLSQTLTDAEVDERLKTEGMDTPEIQAAMHDPGLQPILSEGRALLQSHHAGTPLLVISSSNYPEDVIVLEGVQSLATLEKTLKGVQSHSDIAPALLKEKSS
jgi:protein-disulfide isomerase